MFRELLSTISAHGRALKHSASSNQSNVARISTISAHGRALKPHTGTVTGTAALLSTISAHGRALKQPVSELSDALELAFNNFGSRSSTETAPLAPTPPRA